MKNGEYELVKAPEGYPGKKYRGKYCYEHHLAYWESTKKIVGPDCVIHHKDGNKRNNNIDNLELLESSSHNKLHGSLNKIVHKDTCLNCGVIFIKNTHRAHQIFCSRRCLGKYHGRKKGELT